MIVSRHASRKCQLNRLAARRPAEVAARLGDPGLVKSGNFSDSIFRKASPWKAAFGITVSSSALSESSVGSLSGDQGVRATF